MVSPKLNREIFMNKCLIEWTHVQLKESKGKLNYRKKIFSEIGKFLFPIVFNPSPFAGPE